MSGLEEKLTIKHQPVFNAEDCKVFVGGVEMVGGDDWDIKSPRKWYTILDKNEGTFTVEMTTQCRILTVTLDNKELDKFLELEDSLETPFSATNMITGETL